MSRRLRIFVCLASLASAGHTFGQPPTPASPLRSFDWTYQSVPEPGNRHWFSRDGVVWTETTPSGHSEVQRVGAAAQVGQCHGVITTKSASPTSQTFIPDPDCPQMVLLFRFANEAWRPLGLMRAISTGSDHVAGEAH